MTKQIWNIDPLVRRPRGRPQSSGELDEARHETDTVGVTEAETIEDVQRY